MKNVDFFDAESLICSNILIRTCPCNDGKRSSPLLHLNQPSLNDITTEVVLRQDEV